MSYLKIYPQIIDDPNNILNLDKYNGRINLLDNSDPNFMFNIQERMMHKNKATSYSDALYGIWEDNLLSRLYFSAENVQILQNAIRAGVYEKSNSKFVVSPPNVDVLKVIMRSVYLQYVKNSSKVSVTSQIEVLNNIVLEYAIPATYNEAVGYVKYCEDQSTLVVPLELPLNHDREYKQLELKPWI
jgi:hypothetical protein